MRPWRPWLAMACVLWIGCKADDDNTNDDDDSAAEEGDDTATNTARMIVRLCDEDVDCDDGFVCNGVEKCNDDGICLSGTPMVCDDDIDCTRDVCREEVGGCTSFAPDADGDGHADADCVDTRGNPLGDDCDDADPMRFAGNTEVCDAQHHDEDCDSSTFGFLDADGDGVYNANCCNRDADDQLICGMDCDDANPTVKPGATEACDGLDNDCNGTLDHPLEDQDGDGVGNAVCGGTDCDDKDPMTYAGATEWCDGLDNDCSDGGGPDPSEIDRDGDDFVPAMCVMVDGGPRPNDCSDEDGTAFPDAPELCNAVDDDCDGRVDEGAGDCGDAVVQVSAYYRHRCAVIASGRVYCWGENHSGHLGTGATEDFAEVPAPVRDARKPDLLLGQVKQVSTGFRHTCATHFDGRVSCWGRNSAAGELGTGSMEELVSGPQYVVDLEDVVEVGSGDLFSCALHGDGTVSCWGDGFFGELGRGYAADSPYPDKVLDVDNAIDLSVGATFACAVLDTGRVKCWGDNHDGQIGDLAVEQMDTPTLVFGLSTAVKVACGGSHSCAILSDSTMRCWGDNSRGQLGNGETGLPTSVSQTPVLRPSLVLSPDGSALTNIVEVSAYGAYITAGTEYGTTCARLTDGQVQCWGAVNWNQLGTGEYRYNQLFPKEPVFNLTAHGLAVGDDEICAVTNDGQLACWGGPWFESTPETVELTP